MSWSAFYSEIDGKLDEFVPPAAVQEFDHVKEQFDHAVRVAVAMIESKVLGVGFKWGVSLSGHANPGHAPTPGWANDHMTVSVSQITTAPVPPAASAPVVVEASPAPEPEVPVAESPVEEPVTNEVQASQEVV